MNGNLQEKYKWQTTKRWTNQQIDNQESTRQTEVFLNSSTDQKETSDVRS